MYMRQMLHVRFRMAPTTTTAHTTTIIWRMIRFVQDGQEDATSSLRLLLHCRCSLLLSSSRLGGNVWAQIVIVALLAHNVQKRERF